MANYDLAVQLATKTAAIHLACAALERAGACQNDPYVLLSQHPNNDTQIPATSR